MYKNKYIYILEESRKLFLVLTLTILFLSLIKGQFIHAKSDNSEILGYAFGDLPPVAQDSLKEAIQNRPSTILEGGTFFIVGNFEMSDMWGIGHLGAAIGNEPPNWGESIWFIIKDQGVSTAALQDTQLFDEFLNELPDQLKRLIEPRLERSSVSPETFLFPWDKSQTWRYTYGWHGGTNLSLDFAPSNVAANNTWVLASLSGTINMVCGGVGYDTNQIAVNLNTTSGITTYRHIEYNTYISQNINNQTIPQGKKISLLYNGNQGSGYYNTSVAYPWPSCVQGSSPSCVYIQYNTYCGAGTGPHVHWTVPTKPFTVEGWTVGLDGIWTKSGQANRGVGSSFTSSNPPIIDNTPPTIVSVIRASPNPSSASKVIYTITFSEDVSGVSISAPFEDFTFLISGISGEAVASVTPISASVYTVSINTGSGSGSLRIDIPSSATITDLAGNPISNLPFTSGESYTLTEPDLIIKSVIVSPPQPMNFPFDVTITIENQGESTGQVTIYRDIYFGVDPLTIIDSSTGCPIPGNFSRYDTYTNLAPGQIDTKTITINNGVSSGLYQLWAYVDSRCLVREAGEVTP